MAQTINMPALGESVTEGTVSQWLKQVGDTVTVDEPLLEVSTDKVDTEIPSPVAGVITKILVQEDDIVQIGAPLCEIGDSAEEISPDSTQDQQPKGQTAMPSAQDVPGSTIPSTVQDSDSGPVVSWNYPQVPPVPPKAPAVHEAAVSAVSASSAPTASAGGNATGQKTPVNLPALGESVTEGTVSQWLKKVGDSIDVDEPLLEVSTDKVDTEIPSPVAGYLSEIVAEEDTTVEVGSVLAYISSSLPDNNKQTSDQQIPSIPTPPVPAAPVAPPTVSTPPIPAAPPATPVAQDAPKPVSADAQYVTPIVRKLAKDKGVDLGTLTGTGVGGRIRKQDVLDAAQEMAVASAQAKVPASKTPATVASSVQESELRGKREKMSRLRQVIAQRMMHSLQSSAQLTTVVEVDCTRLVKLRSRVKDEFQSREGTKLTFLPFFVKAATEALKSHPKINASIEDKEVIYHGEEHIGIAVDTPRGLMVPVVRNAGELNIGGLARKINDLARRTRDSQVKADELSGSTFTITNTGSGGALFDTPIINQPEVAILGLGAIVKRPAVIKDSEGNDTFAVRSMCYLALSYDHRLVDGADAARYLMAVKNRLEEGDFSAELGLS